MNPTRFLPIVMSVALAIFAGAGIQSAAAGENLIKNPSFESGNEAWSLFVPEAEKTKGCSFSVESTGAHSGMFCAVMNSDDFARYSLTSNGAIKIVPGERYRITAWIGADVAAKAADKTPGVVIRFILRKGNVDATDSPAVFVGLNSKVALAYLKKPYDLGNLAAPLPNQWTKVEAVFEIPTVEGGLDTMGLGIFGQNTSGKIYVDDVVLEKVDASTPLAPVVPCAN